MPLIPGYDVAGEVVQIGAGVDTVAPGDRVYVHYDYSCGGAGTAWPAMSRSVTATA